MNRDDIRKTLRDIAREIFEDEALEVTDSLGPEDVKAWDSLGHIRLITATEEAFQISLTIDEIESLKSIGQIATLVAEKA
jgi:acyl carrier protein